MVVSAKYDVEACVEHAKCRDEDPPEIHKGL
jgi:hypothetical protein